MSKAQFVTVTQAESGQKLLQFLKRRLKGDVPQGAIQRWIRKGQVRVDKGRKKPFDRINEGQIVRIPPYTPGEEKAVSTHGKLPIIHEDDHVLVIAKPAGLAVHGGDKVDDSITARIRARFSEADFMPTLAHRLDKDTSGLLLAAKDYPTLTTLNNAFASGAVTKLYLTWVNGSWPESDTTLLEDRMEKQGTPGNETVQTGTGKVARARITPLIKEQDKTLLAVELLTGRTHQIRVQLASRGHAVLGDRKYGKGHVRGNMRLHCFLMGIDGQTFTLPPDWNGKWQVPDDILCNAQRLVTK